MAVKLTNRNAIIDRKSLWEDVAAIAAEGEQGSRKQITAVLQDALTKGRSEIALRMKSDPRDGHGAAHAQSFLIDQIIRLIYDYAVNFAYPAPNRSAAERIALVAVGGYGRGEMAPHSDVDISFITPLKRTPWTEQVVESILYMLWDLGLKVGRSSRSIDETVKMAQEDLTIRTALLESRFVWGNRDIYEEARIRFWAEVVGKTGPEFVRQKMEERDERHKKMGNSRYVVEPNIKEGKGGLRDLQTLYWIGKYLKRVKVAAALVDTGLFSAQEYGRFREAENFLWAVRCQLHNIAGRAEERLTFDLQREVAAQMGYEDSAGQSAVERFMQAYFLNAKTVGDVTGLFLAHLDETEAKRGMRFIPTFTRRPRKLNGFKLDRGRLNLPEDNFFAAAPIRMIEIFYLADKYGLEIHPMAMRAAQRDARLLDENLQNDPAANALFMDILTSSRDPESVLRWMNEATVFGRFVPDFGQVVAQMQFDMYHHYTVDEHTIRAIGLLAEIERGEHDSDHPLSTAIMGKIANRRILFTAVLLHDIAKGRGGDHSVLGAEVAQHLCPRLGLDAAETETVAWLVENHLAMSATAFKRDISDFKTVLDFGQRVKSLTRLRLLLVLTVVDIRAVGPGIWNSWKRQLLSDLFEATEEVLRPGYKHKGREDRIAAKRAAVAAAADIPEKTFAALATQMPDSYWIAEPEDIVTRNLELLHKHRDSDLVIDANYYPDRGATLITVFAADHPGLFYRIAGAIHLAGGNIIDARIHTNRKGMAVDNFLVQDPLGRPFREAGQLDRLKQIVTDSLSNRHHMTSKLAEKPTVLRRADTFRIVPSALIDNSASNRFTVIEVNAQDRPALLNRLAQALFESKTLLHSAHIATYGERAVDTFYVTDLLGSKIESKARLASLQSRILEAASQVQGEGQKAA